MTALDIIITFALLVTAALGILAVMG